MVAHAFPSHHLHLAERVAKGSRSTLGGLGVDCVEDYFTAQVQGFVRFSVFFAVRLGLASRGWFF